MGPRGVNILVDRHHAALLYSLQLLFEDRLGMTLFVPQGHEWWDAGIWRFGEGYGDDRLARQFLLDTAPTDPHYPDRLIRGVTLDEARSMPWAYVMATVQDNQRGFHHFASEVGAEYMAQIGNVNQIVDWFLDPLALISTGVPSHGRGIHYHPEFDATYREPVNTTVMRSFVNCFDSTPCYALAEQLPVAIHGIDGKDGNVTLTSEMADLMAASGWGWHDKVQGDGYGFVIHGWAAVGRPLIGHASHYRGTAAAAFWQDGVTCIDLDRHSIEEVRQWVAGITPDEHRAMCRAIRMQFDELVDFAAEGSRIAEFLGRGVAVAA